MKDDSESGQGMWCPDCKKPIWEEMRGDNGYCRAFHGWYACEEGFCHLAERK